MFKVHRPTLLTAALLIGSSCSYAGCARHAESAASSASSLSSLPEETAEEAAAEPISGVEEAVLTYAPEVPPPIARDHATRVVVHLEVRELEMRLAEGVKYTFWTFGGRVPGKFIRVRQGDLVEFHLQNHPDNKMPHNIDLHAVNGPGGGAVSSLSAPGHTSTFSFRALNAGLFVYHCATAPVGMHIGNGMYGLILVEPKGGLPKVDRELYVMQGEVYTLGGFGQAGLQPFSMEKAMREQPDYVVFNGAVDALQDANALRAKVGETVRVFAGNGGPNLTSSFHVIGEIFDRVYPEGGTSVLRNIQTSSIPPGGAALVEFKVQAPGTYLLVDHAIFRAFNKGALAQLKVEGAANKNIYSGKISDEIYRPEGGGIQTLSTAAPLVHAKDKAERVEFGQRVFTRSCAACHQATGLGIPGAFPPLAGSDYLNADKQRAIGVVVAGLTGEVTINGNKFNGTMPAWELSSEDIANTLTYVYNSWGNAGHEVTSDEVDKERATRAAAAAAAAAKVPH